MSAQRCERCGKFTSQVFAVPGSPADWTPEYVCGPCDAKRRKGYTGDTGDTPNPTGDTRG